MVEVSRFYDLVMSAFVYVCVFVHGYLSNPGMSEDRLVTRMVGGDHLRARSLLCECTDAESVWQGAIHIVHHNLREISHIRGTVATLYRNIFTTLNGTFVLKIEMPMSKNKFAHDMKVWDLAKCDHTI